MFDLWTARPLLFRHLYEQLPLSEILAVTSWREQWKDTLQLLKTARTLCTRAFTVVWHAHTCCWNRWGTAADHWQQESAALTDNLQLKYPRDARLCWHLAFVSARVGELRRRDAQRPVVGSFGVQCCEPRVRRVCKQCDRKHVHVVLTYPRYLRKKCSLLLLLVLFR